MLIYHPGHDAYHCVFRMIAVAEFCKNVEKDKAKILDFYLLYPALLSNARLPNSFRSIKRVSAQKYNPYHDVSDPVSAFRDMQTIQDAALRCMAAAGLIDAESFEKGLVVRTTVKLPAVLKEMVGSFVAVREPLSGFVLNHLTGIPLNGVDGLKHRTHLLDYRYDFV